MAESGSAEYTQAAYNQSKVVITGIDQEFDVTLSLAQSACLLNAFTVSGNVLDNNTNVEFADTATDAVLPSTVISNAILAAVNGPTTIGNGDGLTGDEKSTQEGKHALNGYDATGAPVTAGSVIPPQSVNDWLTYVLKADLNSVVAKLFNLDFARDYTNTVAHVSPLSGISASVDAPGGADSIVGLLSNGTTGSGFCETIYTQLPDSSLDKYEEDGDHPSPSVTSLPLAVGDVLTFVFDLSASAVDFTESGPVVGPMGGAPSGSDNSASPDPTATNNGAYVDTSKFIKPSYTPASKRIAINMIMGGLAGAAAGDMLPFNAVTKKFVSSGAAVDNAASPLVAAQATYDAAVNALSAAQTNVNTLNAAATTSGLAADAAAAWAAAQGLTALQTAVSDATSALAAAQLVVDQATYDAALVAFNAAVAAANTQNSAAENAIAAAASAVEGSVLYQQAVVARAQWAVLEGLVAEGSALKVALDAADELLNVVGGVTTSLSPAPAAFPAT
jgi:hypothetical protein